MERIDIINKMRISTLEISPQVVIYGAGNFAKLCAEILKRNGFEVIFFIDKYKYEVMKECEGVPVVSLEDERLTVSLKANTTCILGIFNAYVDLYAIESEIRKSGFKSLINPMELHSVYYEEFGDYFWLGNDEAYQKSLENIQKAYTLLADSDSKNLFQNILEYRQSKRLDLVKSPQNVRVQYFPEDIPVRYPELSFVDCGAFDGDTLMKIVNKGLPLRVFTAFEPDIENINRLSLNLKKHVDAEGYIFPCGVWNRSEQLRFNGGVGSASHISETGDSVIQVVALDEVLINHEINFIKMDIEGAEIQALEGAVGLIRANEPILAISAYHKFDDLWTIPLLLDSWGLSYRFYLRVYEYNGFGLVYYAIPEKYLNV